MSLFGNLQNWGNVGTEDELETQLKSLYANEKAYISLTIIDALKDKSWKLKGLNASATKRRGSCTHSYFSTSLQIAE